MTRDLSLVTPAKKPAAFLSADALSTLKTRALSFESKPIQNDEELKVRDESVNALSFAAEFEKALSIAVEPEKTPSEFETQIVACAAEFETQFIASETEEQSVKIETDVEYEELAAETRKEPSVAIEKESSVASETEKEPSVAADTETEPINASDSIVLPLHELESSMDHDAVYQELLTYVKGVLPRAEEYRVKGDGHCFFRAVAKTVFGSPDLFANVRQDVVNEVEANKERYQHFFSDGITIELWQASILKNGWGDYVCCRATCECYRRPLVVVRKHTDQDPTLFIPDVHSSDHYDVILTQLDESSPGSEHYDALLLGGGMQQTKTKTKGDDMQQKKRRRRARRRRGNELWKRRRRVAKLTFAMTKRTCRKATKD